MDALQYEFMQNAFIAAFLASVACGIIGTYVVVRRMVSISGGISHGSLGGVGLAYYFGTNPVLGALGFAVAAALGMGLAIQRTRIPEDTAIGLIWATGMSLGALFISLKPGFAPDLAGYLFGNILLVSKPTLIIMAALDAVIVLVTILLYKEFLAISFDEEFSSAMGLPAGCLYLVLLVLIALTVVVVLRVVGIVLLIALLTLPAAMARHYTSSLRRMMLLSIPIGVLFTLGGLLISYQVEVAYDLRVPSGPAIILFAGAIFALSLMVHSLRAKARGKRGVASRVIADPAQKTREDSPG